MRTLSVLVACGLMLSVSACAVPVDPFGARYVGGGHAANYAGDYRGESRHQHDRPQASASRSYAQPADRRQQQTAARQPSQPHASQSHTPQSASYQVPHRQSQQTQAPAARGGHGGRSDGRDTESYRNHDYRGRS